MPDKDDVVIGASPQAGTQVPKWSKFNLLLHKGPVLIQQKQFDQQGIARRLQQWINVSIAPNMMLLQGDSWYLTTTIQQMGRLDCKLIEEDARINALSDTERQSPAETASGFYHMTLGGLWVLGSFQILYTLDKMMKRKRVSFAGLHNTIKDVRGRFIRLRGPLAKGEGRVGDFPFPHQAVRIAGSTCWAVGPGTLISRIDLSDDFINLLDAIAKHPGAST